MEHTRNLIDWKMRRGVERCNVLFGEDRDKFDNLDVVVKVISRECEQLDRQWAEIGCITF